MSPGKPGDRHYALEPENTNGSGSSAPASSVPLDSRAGSCDNRHMGEFLLTCSAAHASTREVSTDAVSQTKRL